MLRAMLALGGLLLTGAVACHPKGGLVEGDVYLLMQSGDVKRGAGNTVRLLANAGDSVQRVLRRSCQRLAQPLAVWSPTEVVDTIHTALARAVVADAPTGVNGHYRFAHLQPGQYVLWAETVIGDHAYTWWAPITLAAGDSLRKDLDNSTEARSAVYCDSAFTALESARRAAAESLNAVRETSKDSMARARDSLARLRQPIVTVELTPQEDTIRLKAADVVLGRSLVRRVLNGRGQEVKGYELSFTVARFGNSEAVFGDTLPLQQGFNTVAVWVSAHGVQVPAKRKLTFIVP